VDLEVVVNVGVSGLRVVLGGWRSGVWGPDWNWVGIETGRGGWAGLGLGKNAGCALRVVRPRFARAVRVRWGKNAGGTPALPGMMRWSSADRVWCGVRRAEQAPPLQGVTALRGGKSPITFVTEFGGAESYRFFLGSGTDLRYELALFAAVGHSGGAADGLERGSDCGGAGAFGWERVGGWRGAFGASG
jgi:hypothetical protein